MSRRLWAESERTLAAERRTNEDLIAAQRLSLEHAHRRHEDTLAMLREERERSDRLLREILQLRREGFQAPAELPAPVPTDELPVALWDAIDKRAPEDGETRRRLATWATMQVRLRGPEADVAAIQAEILEGADLDALLA